MRKPRELYDYINADYVEDLNQRRSTTGYVYTVAECIISWKTKLQDTIALLTTETEYMATVKVSKEAL